jgi:phospholipid transport system transporter-binding protein
MPSADPTSTGASVERTGDVLRFTGALLRADVATLWKQAILQLDGVHRFDLNAVSHVDSAGVALLAELAERCDGVQVDGLPAGLSELRAAYRLTPTLAFAAA